MLNDKGRPTLKHLPARQRWPALETGVVRLPASRICGGWAAGWADWYPWQIESFTLTGDFATVRSLTDRRRTRTIDRRQLEHFVETAPFGRVSHSRDPIARAIRAGHTLQPRNPRYV